MSSKRSRRSKTPHTPVALMLGDSSTPSDSDSDCVVVQTQSQSPVKLRSSSKAKAISTRKANDSVPALRKAAGSKNNNSGSGSSSCPSPTFDSNSDDPLSPVRGKITSPFAKRGNKVQSTLQNYFSQSTASPSERPSSSSKQKKAVVKAKTASRKQPKMVAPTQIALSGRRTRTMKTPSTAMRTQNSVDQSSESEVALEEQPFVKQVLPTRKRGRPRKVQAPIELEQDGNSNNNLLPKRGRPKKQAVTNPDSIINDEVDTGANGAENPLSTSVQSNVSSVKSASKAVIIDLAQNSNIDTSEPAEMGLIRVDDDDDPQQQQQTIVPIYEGNFLGRSPGLSARRSSQIRDLPGSQQTASTGESSTKERNRALIEKTYAGLGINRDNGKWISRRQVQVKHTTADSITMQVAADVENSRCVRVVRANQVQSLPQRRAQTDGSIRAEQSQTITPGESVTLYSGDILEFFRTDNVGRAPVPRDDRSDCDVYIHRFIVSAMDDASNKGTLRRSRRVKYGDDKNKNQEQATPNNNDDPMEDTLEASIESMQNLPKQVRVVKKTPSTAANVSKKRVFNTNVPTSTKKKARTTKNIASKESGRPSPDACSPSGNDPQGTPIRGVQADNAQFTLGCRVRCWYHDGQDIWANNEVRRAAGGYFFGTILSFEDVPGSDEEVTSNEESPDSSEIGRRLLSAEQSSAESEKDPSHYNTNSKSRKNGRLPQNAKSIKRGSDSKANATAPKKYAKVKFSDEAIEVCPIDSMQLLEDHEITVVDDDGQEASYIVERVVGTNERAYKIGCELEKGDVHFGDMVFANYRNNGAWHRGRIVQSEWGSKFGSGPIVANCGTSKSLLFVDVVFDDGEIERGIPAISEDDNKVNLQWLEKWSEKDWLIGLVVPRWGTVSSYDEKRDVVTFKEKAGRTLSIKDALERLWKSRHRHLGPTFEWPNTMDATENESSNMHKKSAPCEPIRNSQVMTEEVNTNCLADVDELHNTKIAPSTSHTSQRESDRDERIEGMKLSPEQNSDEIPIWKPPAMRMSKLSNEELQNIQTHRHLSHDAHLEDDEHLIRFERMHATLSNTFVQATNSCEPHVGINFLSTMLQSHGQLPQESASKCLMMLLARGTILQGTNELIVDMHRIGLIRSFIQELFDSSRRETTKNTVQDWELVFHQCLPPQEPKWWKLCLEQTRNLSYCSPSDEKDQFASLAALGRLAFSICLQGSGVEIFASVLEHYLQPSKNETKGKQTKGLLVHCVDSSDEMLVAAYRQAPLIQDILQTDGLATTSTLVIETYVSAWLRYGQILLSDSHVPDKTAPQDIHQILLDGAWQVVESSAKIVSWMCWLSVQESKSQNSRISRGTTRSFAYRIRDCWDAHVEKYDAPNVPGSIAPCKSKWWRATVSLDEIKFNLLVMLRGALMDDEVCIALSKLWNIKNKFSAILDS